MLFIYVNLRQVFFCSVLNNVSFYANPGPLSSGVDGGGNGRWIYPLKYLTGGVAYEIIPQYFEKLIIFCLDKSTDFALKLADF